MSTLSGASTDPASQILPLSGDAEAAAPLITGAAAPPDSAAADLVTQTPDPSGDEGADAGSGLVTTGPSEADLRPLRQRQRGYDHAIPIDGMSVTVAIQEWQKGFFDHLTSRYLPIGELPPEPAHLIAQQGVTALGDDAVYAASELARARRRPIEADPDSLRPALGNGIDVVPEFKRVRKWITADEPR